MVKVWNYIIIIAVVAIIITLIFDQITHINETTYSAVFTVIALNFV